MSIDNVAATPSFDSSTPSTSKSSRYPGRGIWALSCLLAMVVSQPAQAGANGANRVRALTHHTVSAQDANTPAGTTAIRIVGTRTPTFTMYKLERPARVVVDIANAKLDRKLLGRDAKATWSVGSWSVTQVESHALESRGRATVRVIVSMARAGTYDVKAVDNDLLVVVTPRAAAPPKPVDGHPRTGQLESQLSAAMAQAVKAQELAARAKRAASDAQSDAERAASAERQANKTAAAARAKAAASEAQLRQLRGVRAEASAAKRQIAKLEAEAAKAKLEAERRARERRAAERREAELRKAAERREVELRKAAEQAVAEARAEALSAQARAEERVRRADERSAQAKSMIADAEARMASAKKAQKAARKAHRSAKAAKSQLTRRDREAKSAEKRLAERLAEAERAEKAAREYLRRAESARGDSDKASSLRSRAEKAAKAADKRRAEAERAAKTAEQARSEAEKAARAAEQRQQRAVAAARAAEREKSAAEVALSRAEARRVEADKLRRAADKRRTEAEAAAAEASTRATRARELRTQEEAAYAKFSAARQRAADDQRAAAAVASRIERDKRLAKKAETRLSTTHKRVAEAERRLEEMSQRKHASRRELAKLRAGAKRLTREHESAQSELKTRRNEVTAGERKLADLEHMRASKAKELAQVERAALTAKSAREREERLLSELVEQRAVAERALQTAESERERAEARREAAEKRAAKQTRMAQKAKTSTTQKTNASTPAKIARLSFTDRERAARVVIGIVGEAEPRVLSTSGRKAILEIPSATLPPELRRTLDTSRYAGPIEAISAYPDPRNRNQTRLVVQLNRSAKSALKRSGSTYYWDFAKTRAEVAQAGGTRNQANSRKRRGARETRSQTSMVVGGYGASSTPITQKSVAQLSRNKRKVYRGTKIDLDFKDADIHNLLRTLADVGGVNIVIPDEIQARVTVRLRRVPWDQALEVILASKGLWYRREGNLYRVADRKKLDAEDEAEAQRLANLVKTEAPEPEIFTLNYAVAEQLKDQLAPLLSPKGRVEVDTRTNSLIINDVRANRRRVVDLLKLLDTQTPQVQIEARIVEARSSFSREIGVQWGGSANASREGGNATGLIFPNSIGVRGGGEDASTILTGVAPSPSDFAVNLPAAVGTGAGGAIGLALGSVGGNLNLSLRLSALEDTGSVRIISAPKITVLDNVRAEISQGVSIPIAVVSANGTQTTFVPADLSLKVTPHVSQRDCSVQMDLEVQKNEPDFVNTGARGDPSILRKEAKTTILVADGETTVIGGIYTRNTGLSYSKVPFFGDLPVLGWFFKNRREADERSEVLVFITPKITNKSSLRCE